MDDQGHRPAHISCPGESPATFGHIFVIFFHQSYASFWWVSWSFLTFLRFFFLFFDDDWWCFHFFSASFVHLVSFGQIHSSFHIFSHHMFGFSEAGREACELYLKWEPANSLGSCFERLLCLWKDLGTGHEKGVDSDWLLFWVMFVSGLLICLMQRQMVGWTLRLAWIDGLMDPGSRLAPWCSSRPSAPETTDMLQARQEVEAELRARQVHLGQDVTWGECTV